MKTNAGENVKIMRGRHRLYRSPDIKGNKRKRSKVFDTIPVAEDEVHMSKLDVNARQWEASYLALKQFKKKFRHCHVPPYHKHLSLSRWCGTQRQNYKKKKLLPDRVRKLNELGFAWNLPDKQFDDKLAELKKFIKKTGHANVTNPENRPLSRWCRHLRYMRKLKHKVLTPEKIKRLTQAGFQWTEPIKESWNQKFLELKEYRAKYGNCNAHKYGAPPNLKSLANWIYKQREMYRQKDKRLTAERIKKLNSLGFTWEIPHLTNQVSRAELLNELKRLYRLRGRLPSARYIEQKSKYPDWLYFNIFGSIIKARKMAGLGQKRVPKPNKYSDAELLNELKRLHKKLGKQPSHDDVREHSKFSDAIYDFRFGGIKKARKLAGLSSKRVANPIKYSDAQLLDELKRLQKKLGRTPLYSDVKKHGKYSNSLYERRLGGLKQARKKAGMNGKVSRGIKR